MAIFLFETRSLRARFYPLTANKPLIKLLSGGIKLFDKWLDANKGTDGLNVITASFLEWETYATFINPGDSLIYAGCAPIEEAVLFKDCDEQNGVGLMSEGLTHQEAPEIVAVKIKEKVAISAVRSALFDAPDPGQALAALLAPQQITWSKAGSIDYYHHPEGLLARLGSDIATAAVSERLFQADMHYGQIPIDPSNRVMGKHPIIIESGAQVSCSILNAENGPIYIGKDARVMEGCLIKGPLFLGEGATLKMGTRIYGPVATGRYCVLGGEIKNSIISDGTNKGHEGYLGDSIIGAFCNFGAGSGGSNVKNTGGEVRLYDYHQGNYRTVGQKFGAIIGDYTRIGVGTQLTTGANIGLCCNLFGLEMPPRMVPDFSWGAGHNLDEYQLEKAKEHISNWLAFKGMVLDNKELQILNHIFDQARREG